MALNCRGIRDISWIKFQSYVTLITKGGEIGSSIIPHKVNPVDFKYSEGNLGDLTGSTRNIAEGVAHSHLSHTSLCGIAKLQVNEASWNEDLNRSWEVLAEPMQAHGRWEDIGIQEPHEKLKELTRGRAVTKENLKRVYRRFIIG
ncbi:Adenylosuccinate lyase [Bertholletia excelsa]